MAVSVPLQLQAPIRPPEAPLSTKEEMVAYATKTAQEAKINPTEVLGTIECESGWNSLAEGDGNTSFGLAQLHHPESDWGLTREEAKNPRVAIDTLVDAFSRGEQRRWTCWRDKYGK